MLRKSVYRTLKNGVPTIIKNKILSTFFPEETELVYDLLKTTDIHGKRVMFDVGAGHGSTFIQFANDGWQVYAFEPDVYNRQESLKLCEGLSNVMVDERAVTDKISKDVPFYRSELSEGISGLSVFDKTHRRDGSVDTTTIKAFCEEKQIDQIDYLKIDAEGFDFFVLKGVDWNKIKPAVIICEFEDGKTEPLGYSLNMMASFLEEKGYRVLVSEWRPVIRRGGPHTWRRFVRFENDLVDKRAWGNIIAVSDNKLFEQLELLSGNCVLRWKIGNTIAKAWGYLRGID